MRKQRPYAFPGFCCRRLLRFCFSKDSPLVDEFNRAMAELKAEGLDDELKSKWLDGEESSWNMPEQTLDGAKGTLRYWFNTAVPPFAYLGENGKPYGYIPEFVIRVAHRMGYSVEITECAFDGLIPAVISGKADIAAAQCQSLKRERSRLIFRSFLYRACIIYGAQGRCGSGASRRRN